VSSSGEKVVANAPVAIIPARFASSRFPGKPLAMIAGRTMIEQVWRRCQQSGAFSRVIVATDDARIAKVASGFGEVVMTSSGCRSGTDRVAEVARTLHGAGEIVNVQGDEPAVHPATLRQLAQALQDPEVQMATLVRQLLPAERSNPNVVKTALALNGDALYFSRSDIPHQRGQVSPTRYAHQGLYGYRREVLLRIAALSPTPLEEAEMLEQLRALEHGIPIRCVLTSHHSVAVDTPGDLARAEKALLELG
jgi:3-deoxy-manno-octulosonate cytidylyltransferase (CMP-KDO synthetase)